MKYKIGKKMYIFIKLLKKNPMGTDLYMNDINNNLVLRIPEYKKKGLP